MKSKLYFCKEKNISNIFSFLNVEDMLKLKRVNSFFSTKREINEIFQIYKILIDEITVNKNLKSHKCLVEYDHKFLKGILKKHPFQYNQNKIEILVRLAGFIMGNYINSLTARVMNIIKDTKLNKAYDQIFYECSKEYINNCDIKSNALLKNSKNAVSNNIGSGAKKQLDINSNLMMNFINESKYSLNFQENSITINSILSIIASLDLKNDYKKIIMTKTLTDGLNLISSNQISVNSTHLYGTLFNKLSESHLLKYIDLTDNKLTSRSIKNLFTKFENSNTLQTIILKQNQISGDKIDFIESFLKNNKSLLFFDISHNLLGHKGAGIIANGLSENFTLKQLNISYNGITSEGAIKLFQDFTSLNLDTIDISGNCICEKSAEFIKKQLITNKQVSYIIFDDNSFSEKGIKLISEGLTNCNGLLTINLSNCKINDSSADFLFKCLGKNNPKLLSLELGYNFITSKSLKSLVPCFSDNGLQSLGNINIEFNKLGSSSGVVLAEIIKKGIFIKNLNVAGNDIGEGIKNFYNELRQSKIVCINLSNNNLCDFCSHIGEVLDGKGGIKDLDLSMNRIDENGFIAIVQNLVKNTTLKKINFQYNKIPEKALEKADKILENNAFKKKFDISNSLLLTTQKISKDDSLVLNKMNKNENNKTLLNDKNKNSQFIKKKNASMNMNLNSSKVIAKKPFK